MFELFNYIHKKSNDVKVAIDRLYLSLHRYTRPENNELRYSQFATLRVKADGFEVISRKK
jgi:hypothetical protein